VDTVPTVPTVVVHVEGDGVSVVDHQRQGCSPAVQTWIVVIVVKVQSGRGPIRIGEITAARGVEGVRGVRGVNAAKERIKKHMSPHMFHTCSTVFRIFPRTPSHAAPH